MLDAVLFIVDTVIDVLQMLWRLAVLLAKTVLEVWDWAASRLRGAKREPD